MAFRDIIPECLLGEPTLLALYCYLLRKAEGQPMKTIMAGRLIVLAENELYISVDEIAACLCRSNAEIEMSLGVLVELDLITHRPSGSKRHIGLRLASQSIAPKAIERILDDKQAMSHPAESVAITQCASSDTSEGNLPLLENSRISNAGVDLPMNPVERKPSVYGAADSHSHDYLFPHLAGVTSPNIEGEYTVRDFSIYYLNYVRTNFSTKTLDNATRVMSLFCTMFGDNPLHSLKLEQVEQFKQSRIESDKVSRTTINIDIRTIKAAFNVAVDYGQIIKNPFTKAKQLKVDDHQKKVLSEDEFERILKAIKEEWFHDIIAFNVLTGLRLGEIMNLKWADYDIRNETMIIQSREGYRVKGGKMREVSLGPDAITLLGNRPHLGEWIFLGDKGHKYTPSHISKKFKKYIRRLGLPEEIHYHRLRDTYCTWMGEAYVPSYIIKELAGHSSIRVTERYLTPNAESKKNAAKKLHLPRIPGVNVKSSPVIQVSLDTSAVQS